MGEGKAFQTAVTSTMTQVRASLTCSRKSEKPRGLSGMSRGRAEGAEGGGDMGAFYTSEQGLGLLL